MPRCCLISTCNKKKVETDFRCPSCREEYTLDSAGYAGVMKLIIKHENEMAIFTVFTDCIQQLLESLNLCTDLQKKDGTLEMLKAILPIVVKFSFKKDIISTITKFETCWSCKNIKLWSILSGICAKFALNVLVLDRTYCTLTVQRCIL